LDDWPDPFDPDYDPHVTMHRKSVRVRKLGYDLAGSGGPTALGPRPEWAHIPPTAPERDYLLGTVVRWLAEGWGSVELAGDDADHLREMLDRVGVEYRALEVPVVSFSATKPSGPASR
jgi:hypothetical protein